MIRIVVDAQVCAGHALCAARAPDVYRLDADGYCCSDGMLVPEYLVEQARVGARHCPEAAIVLVEVGDGPASTSA